MNLHPARTIGSPISALWWPILVWIIPLLLTVVATPVIVKGLGPVDFGGYSTAMAVVAFAVIPPGGAAFFRFAGSVETEALSPDRLVVTLCTIVCSAAGVNILIVGLLTATIDLGLPYHDAWQHTTLLVGMALLLCSTAINQVLVAGLQHSGLWAQAGLAVLLGSGLTPLIALILTVWRGSWIFIILGLAIWGFVGTATLAVVYRILIGRHAQAKPWTAAMNSAIAQFLWRTGLAAAIGSAMAIAERLILSAKIGPDAAGYFAIALTLALLIHGFSFNINVRLSSALSRAFESGGAPTAQPTYLHSVRFNVAIVGLSLTLMLALGRTFLELWLGPFVGGNVHTLLSPLAIAMAGMALTVPTWLLATIAGREMANLGFMISLLCSWGLAAVIMLPLEGATGMALARLTVPVCGIFFVSAVERMIFPAPCELSWFNALLKASAAALACCLTIRLVAIGTGWMELILSAFVGSIAYLTVSVMVGLLNASDFSVIWK